jgi:hypothetical protein
VFDHQHDGSPEEIEKARGRDQDLSLQRFQLRSPGSVGRGVPYE